MTDSTILIVDADHETEEKIVSMLEAEGYLVFAASGRSISSGMAEKINPSLIYLKPTSNSIEGFETCKAIHNIDKFRDVPIILLASLKGPLDPRYTTFYGVVDYLKMPVSSEELIAKTEKILGSGRLDLQGPEEQAIGFMEEETAPEEELSKAQDEYSLDAEINEISETGEVREAGEADIRPIEEESVVTEEPSETHEAYAGDTGTKEISETGGPGEDYSYRDAREKLKVGLGARSMRRRPKQYGLLIPVVVVTAAITIAAAGFLLYRFFISPSEVKQPVMVKPPRQVQQQDTAGLPPREQQKQEQTINEGAPVGAARETMAVVPETKPAEKPVYSAQLGAFKSEGSAEELAKTYKGKGYEAFTHKGTTKNNETVYRVLIGKFENRKEALQLAAKIRNKEKADTTVFSEATK